MTDPSAPRPRFLVNPNAGGGRGRACLERLRALATERGCDVHVSRDGPDLVEQSRAAVSAGCERLVVAGGDGTVHHVVAELAGTRCSLGVVPCGSGNDFASALGIERDPERALEVAISGKPRMLDLGVVEDRPYATVAGVGLDGEVSRVTNQNLRWIGGRLAYPVAALIALFRFVPPRVSIEHDHGRFDGRVMFTVFANSTSFGGGMQIAPRARTDDGLLDVVIVKKTSRARLVLSLPAVYRGTHLKHPAVTVLTTRSATITCDRPMTVYGDGEPIVETDGRTVRFRALAGSLSVVAP